MSNSPNNPLVNAVRQMMFNAGLSEAADIISRPAGSKALNYVDISNFDEPQVVLSGGGPMSYSRRRHDIAQRLRQFADQHERGMMSSNQLLLQLTNMNGMGQGDMTMWWLQAYADAEKVIESPEGKAKISKGKKNKQQNVGVRQSMARNKAADEAHKAGKPFDSSAWYKENPIEKFQ
jgi:hypothetical protein